MKETSWKLPENRDDELWFFFYQLLYETSALACVCMIQYSALSYVFVIPYLVFARWARNARYQNSVMIAPGEVWDASVELPKIWRALRYDPRWKNVVKQ